MSDVEGLMNEGGGEQSAPPPPPPPPPPPAPSSGEWFAGQIPPEPPATPPGTATPGLSWQGDSYFTPALPQEPSKRARRGVLAGAGALVLAVALVVTLLVTASGGRDAAATVLSAINSTLADNTAHMTMSVTTSGGGTPLSGSGDVDFTQGALRMNFDANAAGQQVNVEAVYFGSTVYEMFPELGQIEPGKSWVALDLGSLAKLGGASGAGIPNGNPAAALRLLAEQGNTVTPIGSSTINGIAVQGYSVALNVDKIRSELTGPGVPSWLRDSISGVTIGHPQYKVYIDGQNQLVEQTVQELVTGSGKTVTSFVKIGYSNYGESVSVTAPPPGEVISFDQFLQDIQNMNGSTQS